MSVQTIGHIVLDQQGVAWIDDSNVKVIEVVADHFAYGWSPGEIHFQHPHLGLSQIHAALSYYYDHQSELDAEIEQRLSVVESLAAAAKESPLRAKLRAAGRPS